MNIAFAAMEYAKKAHAKQVRKYTGNPYFDHLAEVAGLIATTIPYQSSYTAIAWLHDTVEDTDTTVKFLRNAFGDFVADGVAALSDLEEGNRAERKALARQRLAKAGRVVQTIKCADMISNTSSIVKHDPKFAVIYLEEKILMLDVLDNAVPQLRQLAYRMCKEHQ